MMGEAEVKYCPFCGAKNIYHREACLKCKYCGWKFILFGYSKGNPEVSPQTMMQHLAARGEA
jgi:ribosomal protein L37AE/L43A